eukprot:g3145.t1
MLKDYVVLSTIPNHGNLCPCQNYPQNSGRVAHHFFSLGRHYNIFSPEREYFQLFHWPHEHLKDIGPVVTLTGDVLVVAAFSVFVEMPPGGPESQASHSDTGPGDTVLRHPPADSLLSGLRKSNLQSNAGGPFTLICLHEPHCAVAAAVAIQTTSIVVWSLSHALNQTVPLSVQNKMKSVLV